MNRDVEVYVQHCLVYQKVKAKHQRPLGVLQPLMILERKWERLCIDFDVGLPKTKMGYNASWVIVDRLSKSTHFLPVKTTYNVKRYTELYVVEIVRFHGIPLSIISDRDPKFTSSFWKSLHKAMGTKLTFSMAFYSQTYGQSKRTIQTLPDMLQACIMDFHGAWDESFLLVELAYNNSFHYTIGMAPF